MKGKIDFLFIIFILGTVIYFACVTIDSRQKLKEEVAKNDKLWEKVNRQRDIYSDTLLMMYNEMACFACHPNSPVDTTQKCPELLIKIEELVNENSNF